MVFKEAVEKILSSVKGHKWLLVALFVIQLMFILIIAFVNVRYQLAITENIQNIVLPLQQADYEAASSGVPLLENALVLYDNYEQLLSNLWKLVGFSVAAFMLINLWSWVFTHRLFRKVGILKLYLMLLLRSFVFFVPLGLINYFILKSAVNQATVGGSTALMTVYSAAGVTAVGFYFLLIALALPSGPFLVQLKKIFIIGLKKVHYIVSALLVSALMVAVSVYLVALSVNWAFGLMVLFIVFFVEVFVFVRVWLVGVVRELE
jgi:hypothetical protein